MLGDFHLLDLLSQGGTISVFPLLDSMVVGNWVAGGYPSGVKRGVLPDTIFTGNYSKICQSPNLQSRNPLITPIAVCPPPSKFPGREFLRVTYLRPSWCVWSSRLIICGDFRGMGRENSVGGSVVGGQRSFGESLAALR